MQIDIQSRELLMTDAIYKYTELRLLYAVSLWQIHIHKAKVRLSNIHGIQGGTLKRCHLQFFVAGMSNIIVEDTESDLYSAIDRAMDRARRTVFRKIDQQKMLLKQGQSPLLEKDPHQ